MTAIPRESAWTMWSAVWYYQQKGLVQIVSEGPGMGTEVIIHIPVKEEIGHVSDITGR